MFRVPVQRHLPPRIARRLIVGGAGLAAGSIFVLAVFLITDETGVLHDLGIIFGSAGLGFGLSGCLVGGMLLRAIARFRASPDHAVPPPGEPPA